MPRPPELNGRPRQRRLANVRAQVAAGAPCHLCGLPIDLTLDRQRDPLALAVDELIPRSAVPPHQRRALALDPALTAPSHRVCNGSRGTKPITTTVRERCRHLVEVELARRTVRRAALVTTW